MSHPINEPRTLELLERLSPAQIVDFIARYEQLVFEKSNRGLRVPTLSQFFTGLWTPPTPAAPAVQSFIYLKAS